MNIISAIIIIIYCLFVIVITIDIKRLNKERDDLNNKALELIDDVVNLNSKLTCKFTEISLIIEESDRNKELYKETIDKIKKVLVNDYQSNN